MFVERLFVTILSKAFSFWRNVCLLVFAFPHLGSRLFREEMTRSTSTATASVSNPADSTVVGNTRPSVQSTSGARLNVRLSICFSLGNSTLPQGAGTSQSGTAGGTNGLSPGAAQVFQATTPEATTESSRSNRLG